MFGIYDTEVKKELSQEKFLLIKAVSHSLWKNVHHLLELLLVAEITGRVPVVYWNSSCLYKEEIYHNGFELYFQPISQYTIYDVINQEFTYYPPIWKYDNLTSDDPNKEKLIYRNIGDMIGSDADVVVSDLNLNISKLIPFVTSQHPVYGLTPLQIYRYLFQKYILLKPEITKEIQQSYEKIIDPSEQVLAVHIPGDFTVDIYNQIREYYNKDNIYHPNTLSWLYRTKKLKDRKDRFLVDETTHLHEIVRFFNVMQYGDPYLLFHTEIKSFLKKYGIHKIFLITDREDILEEYQKTYGSAVTFYNYERTAKNDTRMAEYFETPLNKRSKGVEILKDAYTAAQCDFFIGYGFSNISYGITHLKEWSDTNIKLAYWMFDDLYNFSYELMKTGRYAPKEADGKYRLLAKMTKNSIKKIQRVFQ